MRVRGNWGMPLGDVELDCRVNYTQSVLEKADNQWKVEWTDKESFEKIRKLLNITGTERKFKVLVTSENLERVQLQLRPFVKVVLPRKLSNEAHVGEHFLVKDLDNYRAVIAEVAAKRKQRKMDRERRKKEGTLKRRRKQPSSGSSNHSESTGSEHQGMESPTDLLSRIKRPSRKRKAGP